MKKSFFAIVLIFMALCSCVYLAAADNTVVTANDTTEEYELEFILKVSDITVPIGATTVDVPINIIRMFDTENIDKLAINVIYDTKKFTYDSVTMGSMVQSPATDMEIGEKTPGSIVISFISDGTYPITPALVSADNLFATVRLTVKDTSAAFTSEIVMTPAASTSADAEFLVPKKYIDDALLFGSVTVEKAAPGYDANVLTTKHVGFDDENIDVYYVKSLTLTEGNGEYSVKVGDYELYWSEERQCYVGVTAPENYDIDNKKFYNISISKSTAIPTIKQYGDVTGDNRVNNNDVIAIQNYIQLGTPLAVRYAADTNLDGNLTFTDLSKIRFLVEKLTPIF